MIKKLAKQNRMTNVKAVEFPVSKPFDGQNLLSENGLLSKLTKRVLDEYEKKSTIKKFTRLAMSDADDLSHNDLVKDFYEKNNILQENLIKELSQNKKLWDDLGL